MSDGMMLCGWSADGRNLGTSCEYEYRNGWQPANPQRRCVGCGQSVDVVYEITLPSPRERHAAELRRRGLTWKEIGAAMKVSAGRAAQLGRRGELRLSAFERSSTAP